MHLIRQGINTSEPPDVGVIFSEKSTVPLRLALPPEVSRDCTGMGLLYGEGTNSPFSLQGRNCSGFILVPKKGFEPPRS